MEVLYDLLSGSWVVCSTEEIQGRTIAEIQNGGYFKSLDYALEYADIVPGGQDSRDIYCLWNRIVCEFVKGKRGEYLPVAEGLQTDEQRKWWFANLYSGNINSGYLEKLSAKKGYKFDNSKIDKKDTSNLVKVDKSNPKQFYDDYIKAGGDPHKFYQWQKASTVRGNNNELLGYKSPSDEFKLPKEPETNFKDDFKQWWQDRMDKSGDMSNVNNANAWYGVKADGSNRQAAIDYATASRLGLNNTKAVDEVFRDRPDLKLTDAEKEAYSKASRGMSGFGIDNSPQSKEEADLMKSALSKKDELARLTAEKTVDAKIKITQDNDAKREALRLEKDAKYQKFDDAQKTIEAQGHYKEVIDRNKSTIDDVHKRLDNPPKELTDAVNAKEGLIDHYKTVMADYNQKKDAYYDYMYKTDHKGDDDFKARSEELNRQMVDANRKWNDALVARNENDNTIQKLKYQHIADSIAGDDPNTKLKIKVSAARKDVVGDAKQFLSRAMNGDRFNDSLKDNIGVKTISGRANADVDAANINISRYSNRTTTVHELGHIVEGRDPVMHQRCIQFLESRAESTKTYEMRDLTNDPAYGPSEVGYKDEFMHAYTGKVYKDSSDRYYATEVLSMGFQHMYEDAGNFRKKDPDFFNFTVLAMKGKL